MVRGKAKGKAANGKRYTRSRREKIIQHVLEVNEKKGRGGVASASKKYGVSASSIGKWLSEHESLAMPGLMQGVGRKSRNNTDTKEVLDQLIDLRESIDTLEKELAMKLARFNELKKRV